MQQSRYKTIGVIGGLGPLATADFHRHLLEAADETRDQAFPRILIDADPLVPDRTAALLGAGPSPVPALIAVGQGLVSHGAELLAIPCNTAHAFYPQIQAGLNRPVIHLIDAVTEHLRSLLPAPRRIGLLATDGTIRTALYQEALASTPHELIFPLPVAQQRVMHAIYGKNGIKAGYRREPATQLQQVVHELAASGADIVLLACTELGLVLGEAALPLYNSTQLFAQSVIEAARQTELS